MRIHPGDSKTFFFYCQMVYDDIYSVWMNLYVEWSWWEKLNVGEKLVELVVEYGGYVSVGKNAVTPNKFFRHVTCPRVIMMCSQFSFSGLRKKNAIYELCWILILACCFFRGYKSMYFTMNIYYTPITCTFQYLFMRFKKYLKLCTFALEFFNEGSTYSWVLYIIRPLSETTPIYTSSF